MTHLLISAEGRGSEHWLVRLLRYLQDPDLSGLVSALEKAALIAAFVVAVVGAFLLARLAVRLCRRARLASTGRLYHVRLPEELDRARLAQALAGVAASLRGGRVRPWLGFELRGEAGRVWPLLFAAGVPDDRLRRLIGEALPGSRLEPADDRLAPIRSRGVLRINALRTRARDHAPLETKFAADPTGLLLRSLGDTGPGEVAAVQLLFTAASRRARTRLLADAARLRSGERRRSPLTLAAGALLFALEAVWELFDRTPSRPERVRGPASLPSWIDSKRVNALLEKAREPLFASSLRLAAVAPARGLARAQLRELSSAYAQYEGFSGLRRGLELRRARRFERRLLPLRPPLLLSASELAALCPFPERLGEAPAPLEQALARELAPTVAAPRRGIRIGTSEARGRPEPVFISPRSLLQHVHLLGATGAGKTTLILNVAAQAMSQGLGFLLAEPKGDLVEEVLARVPRRRLDDVVLLDFGELPFPPAFNLLAGGPGQGEAVAAIFSRLFGGNWGPRSDDLLRAAILTLEGGAGDGTVPTLADVLPLLSDPRRRRRYRVSDRVVLQGFWQTWDRFSEGQRQQALAPLANKLRALLLRPAVRDALVQAEAPDLRAAIREGRIVLCPLPTFALGEDGASLFGSVILHRLWQAAQALGPSATRPPFLCLVDEAHRFTALPGGMAEVLAQARGYGLGFLLAHQQLVQLSPELREAIAINCRTKLCFQLDPPDNERMARHFEPHLAASDLLRLGRYQLACRIVEDTLVLAAATAVAEPPPEESDSEAAEIIRLRSHLRSRTKAEVEELIVARFPELEQPPHGEVTLDVTGSAAGTPGGAPDVPPNVLGVPRTHAEHGGAKDSDDSLPTGEDEDSPWAA